MNKKTIKAINKTIEYLKKEYFKIGYHDWTGGSCVLCQSFVKIDTIACGDCPFAGRSTYLYAGCVKLAKEICGIKLNEDLEDDIPLYIGALESLKRCNI